MHKTKVRLLIVDDEERQMKALCETLRDQGYETAGCPNAAAALDLLSKPGNAYDLLLTDLMMPGMDGIELLREALVIDPTLVCILMTGQGTIATAVEAMKSGALDYILKPFKLSAIIPVLTRALQVRKLRMENATLARGVRERTLQLEAANKELEAFSFSVSHDLRAPLRGINGYAKILQDRHAGPLSPEGHKFLNSIISSAAQMGQLIDDLLNFSRTGRQPLARETVRFPHLVAGVVEELAPEREGRAVEIRIGPLPDCQGDPALLKQVLVNLLSNAHKFTRTRPQAVIEVGSEASQPGELLYFVRDNGVGFDMQYADNLFGVFKRLHRASEFEGTGIGLSIVQRIIHRHGGRIWVEAALDKGATFYFTLPEAAPETKGT
ncbi:MAG TPA: response regulator [Chthoniobacteraceae bacterium]|nr:response regulator [Chthoniobacteraceae bacterium]